MCIARFHATIKSPKVDFLTVKKISNSSFKKVIDQANEFFPEVNGVEKNEMDIFINFKY